tara:strand:+ start:125 stop:496 length:372 start_codon:yes stop_codon:yes gene_type:complete
MWQLRKLSTNENLSEVGPLPHDWGPIFGLHGFEEKLSDLSWIGPTYSDMGWIKLSEAEKKALRLKQVVSRVDAEKELAANALSSVHITVERYREWADYLTALDLVVLQVDVTEKPYFPIRPII